MDYTPLVLYTILGTPLLGSYYWLYRSGLGKKYWPNENKNAAVNHKYLYIISGMVASIAGVYLLWYLTEQLPKKEYYENIRYLIYTGLCLLLCFSLLWIPTLGIKYINTIVLIIVAIGAIILFSVLCSNKDLNDYDKTAIAMAFFLMFHTSVLDATLWSGFSQLKF
jgi:hypothetical protein